MIVIDTDMPNNCAECPLHTDAMSKVFCGQTHKCAGKTVACYERMKDCPIKCDIEDIKAEIFKNVLDEPVKNGTNAEMACFNSALLLSTEIIDKHISGKEKE